MQALMAGLAPFSSGFVAWQPAQAPCRSFPVHHLMPGPLGWLAVTPDASFAQAACTGWTSLLTWSCAGPDATLTICLWQQGFAITDPAPSHRAKHETQGTVMDPMPALTTAPGPMAKANDMITHALQALSGSCGADCQVGCCC